MMLYYFARDLIFYIRWDIVFNSKDGTCFASKGDWFLLAKIAHQIVSSPQSFFMFSSVEHYCYTVIILLVYVVVLIVKQCYLCHPAAFITQIIKDI